MVGCLLPWYTVGGDGGLPAEVYRAFTYPQGLVAFLAALATLALIALPYATGPRPAPLDRGIAFGVLAVAALAGIALWAWAVHDAPVRAAARPCIRVLDLRRRVVVLARAAFEISQEPPRR